MRAPHITLLALLALAGGQMLYFNRVIDKAIVAAHFNVPGNPNGWQTKQAFFETYVLILVLGVGLAFGFPYILARMPAQFINLPHRDYWLAPERRDQTMSQLADQLGWIGVATVALLLVAMQVVLSANLSLNPHIEPLSIIVPLVCYVAFSAWWVARFVSAYSRPPA